MLHGDKVVLAALRHTTEQDFELQVSAVTIAEVYAGMRRGEEVETTRFTGAMQCFPITREIGERAGEIKMNGPGRAER